MDILTVRTQTRRKCAKKAHQVALCPQRLDEERKFRNPLPSARFSSTEQSTDKSGGGTSVTTT